MQNNILPFEEPIDESIESDELYDIFMQFIHAVRDGSSDEDTDYKSQYYGLFNGISLIIENTNTYTQTIAALKHLQRMAEEAYINQGT